LKQNGQLKLAIFELVSQKGISKNIGCKIYCVARYFLMLSSDLFCSCTVAAVK